MKKKRNILPAILLAAVCALFAMLLIFPEEASKAAEKSISVCLHTLIPSLFPFFVLSSLSVSLGLSEHIGKVFSRFMRPLFKCSKKTASPFLLGLLSGFPIGAVTSVNLYKNGEISRGDCGKALSFSNNPSAGFIVSVVGSGIFGSARLGWILYIAVTAASIVSGMIVCRAFPDDGFYMKKNREEPKSRPLLNKLLCAVKDGGAGVLNVSAFVVFFSTVCKTAESIFNIPYPLSALISGFFEISSGVSSVVPSLLPAVKSAVIAAVILSWSGLSVHGQVLLSVSETDVSAKPYIFSKIISPLFAALFTVLMLLFPV